HLDDPPAPSYVAATLHLWCLSKTHLVSVQDTVVKNSVQDSPPVQGSPVLSLFGPYPNRVSHVALAKSRSTTTLVRVIVPQARLGSLAWPHQPAKTPFRAPKTVGKCQIVLWSRAGSSNVSTVMKYAAITGWGKCMPPAVLSNADLATFLDTSDEWITTRTGIKERRISHVPMTVLSHIDAARALPCAGLDPEALELFMLGAHHAAAMDLNTACTSFLYGLSTATAMVRTGVVRNALVIGVEVISPYMDWSNRNVAVLFGDGAAAVVIEASDEPAGVIAEKLGCAAEARHTLRVRGMGTIYGNNEVQLGDTRWDFDGPEIFKRAVQGMTEATLAALERAGLTTDDVALVVPHQANLRIIE